MAVHFHIDPKTRKPMVELPPENQRIRTIKHSKPYCQCANGTMCADLAEHGAPGGRVKKGQKKLAHRQKSFDNTRADDRKRLHMTRRPGSVSK